jgi:O-antigen ligase
MIFMHGLFKMVNSVHLLDQVTQSSRSWDYLLILLACLTLFALSVGTGPTSSMSVLLLVTWGLSGAWSKGWDWWWGQRQWLLPIFLLMLLPWVSLIWTISPEPGLYPYLHRSHFWLLSFVTACLVFKNTKPEYLAYSFIAGVELVTVVFLFVTLGVISVEKLAVHFMWKGYITYSLLLVVATAFLSFGFRQVRNNRYRCILVAVMLMNLFALALLKGRSGYLAFAALAPFMLVNLLGRQRWWVYLLAGLGLVGSLALSPTVQERVKLALHEVQSYQEEAVSQDTSIGNRLFLWQGATKVFQEYPLLGAGIDGYPVALQRQYPEQHSFHPNPHNFYLYMAASYGLVGLSLYGWFLIALFRRAWPRRDRWQGFMLLTTLIMVMVASLTETTPLQPQTGILLALMAGLPMGD